MIASIVYAIYTISKKQENAKLSKTIYLLGLIGAHLQMTIGIVLYIISPLGFSNFSKAMMKNSLARLYMLEHPLMMLLAIVLITIGYTKYKKEPGILTRHKNILIFYTIGLLLVLSRLPWKAWLNI
ncbi:hypothetical protein [Chryseobacterium sp. M5A1_1a]